MIDTSGYCVVDVVLCIDCGVTFLKPCCVLICCIVCVNSGGEGSSPEFLAMTERREMSLYEVFIYMSLLGFGMDIMFTNFHICGMILLKVIVLLFVSVFLLLERPCIVFQTMCVLCLSFQSMFVCVSDRAVNCFETIRIMFGCGCYFVVECYGVF